MKYLVHLSGGLGSAMALLRTIERYGLDNTEAVFADVRGNSTHRYDGEHADTYRFINDLVRHTGVTFTRLAEGRAVWDVLEDRRVISMVVGNKRLSPCSQELKREPLDRYVSEHYKPDQVVQVAGMGWQETGRMRQMERAKAPYRVWFPLAETPYMDNCHIEAELAKIGIAVPSMYYDGFSHGNCGGFCINGGTGHFARLYTADPDRYRYHEAREQQFQERTGTTHTVLKDRRGGVSRPMTLADFRERLERGEVYDELDAGGCGCFASGGVQMRMDDLVLEAV